MLGMFLAECKSHLPALDSRFRSMIARRTHILRGKICVDGKAHLLCIRDNLLDGHWCWESPAPANIESTCTKILDAANESACIRGESEVTGRVEGGLQKLTR